LRGGKKRKGGRKLSLLKKKIRKETIRIILVRSSEKNETTQT